MSYMPTTRGGAHLDAVRLNFLLAWRSKARPGDGHDLFTSDFR